MGLGPRRPILPAPTDSSLQESAEDISPITDVATDLSRRTDKTSHTIPEDGSPIVLDTLTKHLPKGKLTKRKQNSETSLLIEYYEGTKDSKSNSRKPSVRVRVRPSGSSKIRNKEDNHRGLVQTSGLQKPSYTRKISLGSDPALKTIDPGSVSSLDPQGASRRTRAPPADREVFETHRDEMSRNTPSPELRYIAATSDISSMPGDSMLDVPVSRPTKEAVGLEKNGSSHNRNGPLFKPTLNASNERFSQKVIEKLANKPRMTSGGKRRVRSSGYEDRAIIEDEPKRSGKVREDNRSLEPSNSLLSAPLRSTDQISNRSGASQTSLTNNPKLLRTVEDAIRRLIMPELEEIKKKQKGSSKPSKYDRDASDFSESSMSKDEYDRHLSSGSRRRHRRQKEVDIESPSDRSYPRRQSVDSVSTDEHRGYSRHEKGHHRVRDVAAGAMAGAALNEIRHHGSQNNLEREERRRRRRRSKSRSSHSSRSTSMTESEGVFQKHDVPPMPLTSEVGSDLTRSSLLSSRTGGTATPVQREVGGVVRGSPLEASSPASQTPTKTPMDIRKGLGTHHGNLSEHDLVASKTENGQTRDVEDSSYGHGNYDLVPAVAGGLGGLAAHQLLTDPERVRKYESNLHHQHPIRRGLSPIQSVASYQTTEPNRNSVMQPRSSESLNSLKEKQRLSTERSIGSLSSAPSTDVATSNRPKGMSLENRSEIMAPHKGGSGPKARELDDQFFDEQHSQNERYRDSFQSADPELDAHRTTNHTDESTEEPYLDKVTAGQQVARRLGANPEYVHTPHGVESAVASLYEPSMMSASGSPTRTYSDSMSRDEMDSPRSMTREYRSNGGSPLKDHQLAYSEDELPLKPHTRALSPPHSEALSAEDDIRITEPTTARDLEQSNNNQAAYSPESEITTNPSPIQGPMGGLTPDSQHKWSYDSGPQQAREAIESPIVTSRDAGQPGTKFVPDQMNQGFGQPATDRSDIYTGGYSIPTPPGTKGDEGYYTADNPKSPLYSPRLRDIGTISAQGGLDALHGDQGNFGTKSNGYTIGPSRNAQTPLDEGAIGQAKDNIQSKDIVALMDHLTVRDAHRNARDTEILVTLVRSAAEMRNSFEDMQKFIAEQNELILDTAEKQHEKTQKAVGGPRPLPASSARQARSTDSEEDMTTKRRNIFRRALQGIGSKNTRELQNIEQMLMHLLGEVESLRAVQEGQGPPSNVPPTGLNSADNVRAPTDPGYEPEGQAGTSSTGDRSGFFSNNSSRQADYRGYRRESGNRVSTVIEGDEYEPEQERPIEEQYQSPNRDSFGHVQTEREVNMPDTTPPRTYQNTGSQSAENTPQLSSGTTGTRKHKSNTSSFLPRISRWSKTTASSVADNFRSSNQTQSTGKQRPYSTISRSGSDLGEFAYDPQGHDHLQSNRSFADDQYQDQENRPPSPLIPSQVSEKPKYQAHRNSQNLQHPQPRQGPTGRYQHHLESEAMNYEDDPFSPTSQTSSHWEHQAALSATDPNIPPSHSHYVAQPPLSPISDTYTETPSPERQQRRPVSVRSGASVESYDSQQTGPPRPPKIRDSDPLLPQRPPKVPMTPPPGSSRQATYVDHVTAARTGSPAFDKSPLAAMRSSPAGSGSRKPSGPRPMSGNGSKGDLNAIKRTRFRGSPGHINSDDDVIATY